MASIIVLSETSLGPRLLKEYLNTNREDYNAGHLLDELDMKNEVERAEFQYFLRDYLTFDRKTKRGYLKAELAELSDQCMRGYAEQFMDEGMFDKLKWPAGQTYFPSSHLQSDGHVSRHQKKWAYDEHRRAIIDIVTQIMITKRNDLKRKLVMKQVATISNPSMIADAVTQQEDQSSDSEYTPPGALPQASKRPRKQAKRQTPKQKRKFTSNISLQASTAAIAREPALNLTKESTAAKANEMQSPAATTGLGSRPPSIAGDEANDFLGSIHIAQQPSAPNTPADCHVDAGSIRPAENLESQRLAIEASLKTKFEAIEAEERLKVQYFEKGLEHARKHLRETCMDMQLAADDAEGSEAERLSQLAKGFFSALRDVNKAMQKEKNNLPKIIRKLDME